MKADRSHYWGPPEQHGVVDPLGAPWRSSTPGWWLAEAATAGAGGLAVAWISMGRWANFALVTALILGIGIVLERIRQTARIPWWIAHLWSLPILAIVPLPWAVGILSGSWQVRHVSHIDPALPQTWRLHLFSAASLMVGSAAYGLYRLGIRAATKRPQRILGSPGRALAVLYGLIVYLHLYYGFIVGGHGWTAVLPLVAIGSLSITVPILVRARSRATTAQQLLTVLGIALAILELSRDYARYRPIMAVLIVVFAWSATQLGRSDSRTLTTHPHFGLRGIVSVVLAAGVVIAGTTYFVGTRGATRLGFDPGEPSHIVSRTLESLDVLGSTEAAFSAGAEPGSLAGRSYSELPLLVLPNKFVSSDAPRIAAADLLIDRYLIEDYGYSAPLWVESVLNFPAIVAYVVLSLVSFALTAVLDSAYRRRIWVGLVGPAWILLAYQVLSRVSSFHAALTGTFFILGAIATVWFIARRGPSFGPGVGKDSLICERL